MSFNGVNDPYNPPNNGGAGNSFFDSLRSINLRRYPDRWIGGVCSALAHRIGWDPILVRGFTVLFGIFAFFMGTVGLAIVLYALGWALIPDATDDSIHLENLLNRRFKPAHVGIGLLILIGTTGTFSVRYEYSTGPGWRLWFNNSLLFAIVIVLAVVAFAYAKKKDQPSVGSSPSPGLTPHVNDTPDTPQNAHEPEPMFGNYAHQSQPAAISATPTFRQSPAPQHPQNRASSYAQNRPSSYTQNGMPSHVPNGIPNYGAPVRRQDNLAPGLQGRNGVYQPAPMQPSKSFLKTDSDRPGGITFMALTGLVFAVFALMWGLSMYVEMPQPLIYTAPVSVAYVATGLTLAIRALQGKGGSWLTALSIFITLLLPGFIAIASSYSYPNGW